MCCKWTGGAQSSVRAVQVVRGTMEFGYSACLQDLCAKDLVMGVARLKGAARNIDMALFRKEIDFQML